MWDSSAFVASTYEVFSDELLANALVKAGTIVSGHENQGSKVNESLGQTMRIENHFNIANMAVRNDDDIRKIARELYLMQLRSERGYAL